jgi:hypothetical protein
MLVKEARCFCRSAARNAFWPCDNRAGAKARNRYIGATTGVYPFDIKAAAGRRL